MSGRSALESGLNTTVRHRGKCFHVQTQSSNRAAPTVESMIYEGGRILVRLTASYEDVAARLGFNGDDARHLLELQHADLIRKIRHGMLDDDEVATAATGEVPVCLVDDVRPIFDPREIAGEPGVDELLGELGIAIDAALAAPQGELSRGSSREATGRAPSGRPGTPVWPEAARAPRPWWRRWVILIRLPFRPRR